MNGAFFLRRKILGFSSLTVLFFSYLISDPPANPVDSSFSFYPEKYYYYFLKPTVFAKQSSQCEPIIVEEHGPQNLPMALSLSQKKIPSSQSGLQSPARPGLSSPPLLLWPLPPSFLWCDHTCLLTFLPAQKICSYLGCLISLGSCLFLLLTMLFLKLSAQHGPSLPLVFTHIYLSLNTLYKISVTIPTRNMALPIPLPCFTFFHSSYHCLVFYITCLFCVLLIYSSHSMYAP